MSKQYETGNAKNVANLQKLIEQVTVYTAYNPPVDNLKIVNLNTLYTNSLNAVTSKNSFGESSQHINATALFFLAIKSAVEKNESINLSV